MGEADKLPLNDSPEFQAAVAAAVAKAVPELLAKVNEARGDASWAQTLAMAIATVSDQGVGTRKRVAPEVIKSREDARVRMVDLIVAARAAGRLPSYRLTNKVLLDEQLIDPVWIDNNHTAQPTEIDWPGVPNEAMVPLNDVAKEIHAAFIESIGSIAKEHQVTHDPLKLTKGGLVVRGAPSAASHETTLDRVNQNVQREEGVRVKHKDQPGRYEEKRILGSIHKPAQQTV